jgi:hypothetical protein
MKAFQMNFFMCIFLFQSLHEKIYGIKIDLELKNLGNCGILPPESGSNRRLGMNRAKLKGKFYRDFIIKEPKERIVGGTEVKLPLPW